MEGMQGEQALNTEEETEEPREVHGDAEAAEGDAGDRSDELEGGDVDEGVGDEPEARHGDQVDSEGAEFKVSPDPGEPTASQVEDYRAGGHWPYRSW